MGVLANKDSRAQGAYRSSLFIALNSPATWIFAIIYASALAYLIIDGHTYLLLFALFGLLILGSTFLIVMPLTRNGLHPFWKEALAVPRWKLWCQFGFVSVYLFWLFFLSYDFFTPFFHYIPWIAEPRPLLYTLQVVILLAILRLSGTPWKEVGLGWGSNVWKVTGALMIIPLIVLSLGLAFGWQNPQNILLSTLSLLFTAGIPEEIAFRGILMTRMMRISNPQWSIILSSLLFSLIHIYLNQMYFRINLTDAIAVCIIFDAVLGITFAIITLRTLNLLASIVFHTFFDVMSFALLGLFQGLLK